MPVRFWIDAAGFSVSSYLENDLSPRSTIENYRAIRKIPEREPVPIDVCDRRARESLDKLVPVAEKYGVYLNIENILFNGYLSTKAPTLAIESWAAPSSAG
jgi:sugar phosphate isomerase/epimerase